MNTKNITSKDNLINVLDNTDTVTAIDEVTADVYLEDKKITKHLQKVAKTLEERAEDIIDDAEKSVENDPLKKLVIDESLKDFDIAELTEGLFGNSRDQIKKNEELIQSIFNDSSTQIATDIAYDLSRCCEKAVQDQSYKTNRLFDAMKECDGMIKKSDSSMRVQQLALKLKSAIGTYDEYEKFENYWKLANQLKALPDGTKAYAYLNEKVNDAVKKYLATSLRDMKNKLQDKTLFEDTVDGRSNKVYETEDDEHLDFDMFDFIMGLVSDTWPKPKSPLGRPMRKFQTAGQDDYKKAGENVGVPQVASDSDGTIIVFANETEAFDDIKEVCKLYKFECNGPHEKRGPANHWNFSFNIKVPMSSAQYPENVEDYFNRIGYTIEDVMPSDWARTYRKKMARIEAEAEKLINERTIEKLLKNAIKIASNDNEPLKNHLDNLYKELDKAEVTYTKKHIKDAFMSAFEDDFDDEELEEFLNFGCPSVNVDLF